MNEVKFNQPAAVSPAATSSKGAESARAKVVEAGKDLPVAEPKEESGSNTPVIVAKELQQAVAEMNKFIQSERRDLHFSVDEATGSMVIRVTDSESGELIRQIPNEMFLEMAERAKITETLNLINIHG